MSIFKSDLSRNFAFGFILGAFAVGVSAAPDWQAEFASTAYAAEAGSSSVETDAETAPDSGRIMRVS